MKPTIFFITLILNFNVSVTGQIPVRNLGVSDGLSSNSATSIVQDKFGFIWVGTFNGLNRYDGFSFKTYRNKWQDSLSLVNDHVVTIGADESGIWAGTLKGISFFSFATQDFRSFKYLNPTTQKQEDIEARCSNLLVSDGIVFLGTEDKGLLVLYPNAGYFIQIPYQNTPDFNVQGICTYNGDVYLFVKNVGLCLYDPSNKKLKVVSTVMNEGGKLLPVPDKGLIYVGSQNGLFQYSPDSKLFSEAKYNAELPSKNITGLLFDKQNNLWVATDGEGVSIINTVSNECRYIVSGERSDQLKSGAVYAVYEDRDSRKWIATLRGGISIARNDTFLFKSVRHEAGNKNSLISNFTLSFCEDAHHNIWIGTDGGGLSNWNPVKNTFKNFTHKPGDPSSLSSNFVVNLLADYKGRVWVATFGGGLQLFNKETQTFTRYSTFNPVLNINDFNFWKLFQDKQNRLWAGATRGGALYLFNENKNSWELFDNNLTNIHAMDEDDDGNFWAGDFQELIRVDVLNKRHIRYSFGYPILCIYNDSKSRLWIGSDGGGLALFDKKTHSFRHYTETAGLPNNTVLNVVEDNEGFLWFSSYNGLSKFNPETGEIINFNVRDGLQSNEFNYNAALKLTNGNLIFGGINGFNLFTPETIVRTPGDTTAPLLTAFRINKTPIELTKYQPNGTAVENLEHITLPYSDANIDMDFVTISFGSSEPVQYAYFLSGWDKNWNHTTSGTATYNNLREGHYTLYIKSLNTSGKWNSSPTPLQIIILPPWYRSWWAWIIYLSLGALVIYIFIRYKTYQQQLKYELDLANMRAENEKELSEKKAIFFTNISHEFRNLLTLIINPIHELMHHSEEEEPEEIKVAYNNSKRMLRLVDQLLLFRKAGARANELRIGKYNFYQLCKDVFDSFYYQAKIEDIHYEFVADNPELELYIDAEKMEIAIFNLLSNALKYTPRNGSIRFEIREEVKSVTISISDSGPGIGKHIGNKIFNPYYQVKTLESKTKPGFGIGLYLVKNYVELHKGEISYETEPGEGTTFYLKLQKGTSHFSDDISFISGKALKQISDEIISGEIEPVTTAPTLAPEEIITGKKTVLLVDDNEKLLTYLRSIFAENFNVLTTINGDQAFTMVMSHQPDIVITDLDMPGGMDGFQLCSKIKCDDDLKHIPVILITGKDSDEMKLKCIRSGAEDYILKPFEKDLLMAKVNNLITSKDNLKQYFLNHVTLKENTLSIAENDKLFLDECIKIVEEHLYDDQFAISTLATEIGKSHSSLYKKIKQISGYSVNSFVRMIRLRKAAELLINSNCNIREAATQAGFNDMKNFRQQFQKLFECTPSQYVMKYRRSFQKKYIIKKHNQQS